MQPNFLVHQLYTNMTQLPLYTTTKAPLRRLYKLYFTIFLAGILSLLYHRLAAFPSAPHPLLHLAVILAELWFAAVWLFQQGFRWAPSFHATYVDRLPDELPAVDVLVCTADPDREPPALVADTLLSLMAYDYDIRKLAYYVSDDGGSQLTFHAVYQASVFAKVWLPFCRRYAIEARSPKEYFAGEDVAGDDVDGEKFRRDYQRVKREYEAMQDKVEKAGKLRSVPEETRQEHKGFREWDSKVDPRDHPSIIEVLLHGNRGDLDAEGMPTPSLVYISREKRPDYPHHYKAGALNAMNRVSALMSNAPFILNVDCDMHANNSQALRQSMCFFLDPREGSSRIGYVQFPQSFGALTPNDLYANGVKRIYEIEFFGTNAHNGPMYAGTGSVHRRESLNGRKFTPDFQPNLESNPVKGSLNCREFEAEAKLVTSCKYEQGKPWGMDMGLMYGCAVEDVFTGMVLHSRGWQSVFCGPERKAYLGLPPLNTNDTLIQHKRWSTGLLEIFLSDYCPWTNGPGKLKLGQILCYSFYTLWALWSLPMLCYAFIPPLAMAHGISLFPKASDPWFKLFVFLGLASHAFSLIELLAAKGTVRMWWNETRMWMMKGCSSYLFSVMVIVMKSLGIAEAGFEITSKVVDEEAMKRYKQEIMEFAVPSPMFIPPSALSLLNLFCLLEAMVRVVRAGWGAFDEMAMQILISGYIVFISLPLYEAMLLRKDKGRMPTSVTTKSLLLAAFLFYLMPFLM